MESVVLDWVTGRKKKQKKVAAAPRPVRTEPARPVAAPTPPVVAVTDAEAASEELQSKLLAAFHARIDELEEQFGGCDCGDVEVVFDALRQPDSHEIRQPPNAAQAVLAVCRRRNYSMAELTRLIAKDPALSQALLRHANSAFYLSRFSQKVISIQAAVQRIGTKGVNATVMSQVIEGELSRPGAGLDKIASLVWQHMVRTAPIARGLARAFRQDPEAIYTLGLLHDAGKLVLFDRIADQRKRMRRDLKLPEAFIEIALRLVHESLGGLAALQWGLDPEHAAAIAQHHRQPAVEGMPASEVLFLAERIDLARVRQQPVRLDLWWQEGRLEGDRAKVEQALEAHMAEDEAAA